MKLLLTTAAALALTVSIVDAATRVAVIELGATGTVRRTTTSSNLETSVDGVASFWSALHGYGRKLQHAGMPVVPDLFSRPDSGVVVGLTGVDLDDNMPTLSHLLNEEDRAEGVVGHMTVPGKQCQNMMNNVKKITSVDSTSTISSTFQTQAQNSGGVSGLKVDVTSSNAAEVDAQIAALLKDISLEDGKTVVLHLVVEEEDGAERRRTLARRLEEAQGENQQGGQQQAENAEGENNADGQNNAQGNNNNNNGGFYGYGYFNGYGEYVTPYKTMFQIQYFNVVLWTAVGLVAVLFFSIYLMVYMPLMADTLLFGETARMSQDD
ncbi:hypothetical protein IV203_001015 [Nitzschia inconspicua]|uniref:Uncharacterized protein n=1 Tax=Nitzschia inconspicua TaxID=303405 RepID=A0A9K3L607_9STRA|nr:hypothetical protein IV203_001015 [Nitzschia inconspicua]